MASYTPVTQAEADTMFIFWQESGRNASRTAKQFNKGRTSINRYVKRFNWIAKADAIETKKTNAVAEKQIDDMTMITALQRRVVKNLLARDITKDKFTVTDFALLTRLKLEIKGELPVPDANSNSVTVNLNNPGSNGNGNRARFERFSDIYKLAAKNPRLDPIDN